MGSRGRAGLGGLGEVENRDPGSKDSLQNAGGEDQSPGLLPGDLEDRGVVSPELAEAVAVLAQVGEEDVVDHRPARVRERRAAELGLDLLLARVRGDEIQPVRPRRGRAVEVEEPQDARVDGCALLDLERGDDPAVLRAVGELDELWRRSGGTLPELSPEAIRSRVRTQLDAVEGWDDFQRTPLRFDPASLVAAATAERLRALPDMVRLRGDAAPVDYEVEDGQAVARLRLREGQAKRLRPEEVPALDRPVRFAVQRGRHPPLRADTLPELQALLRKAPRHDREQAEVARGRGRGGREGPRGGQGRHGPRGSRGRGPGRRR